ncbi:hypothetical protein HDU67_002786 [Dinochytrium kinnereticum]|nr:hypothetical protein HDU67_002786 [Dinochytrium kinnereticum]
MSESLPTSTAADDADNNTFIADMSDSYSEVHPETDLEVQQKSGDDGDIYITEEERFFSDYKDLAKLETNLESWMLQHDEAFELLRLSLMFQVDSTKGKTCGKVKSGAVLPLFHIHVIMGKDEIPGCSTHLGRWIRFLLTSDNDEEANDSFQTYVEYALAYPESFSRALYLAWPQASVVVKEAPFDMWAIKIAEFVEKYSRQRSDGPGGPLCCAVAHFMLTERLEEGKANGDVKKRIKLSNEERQALHAYNIFVPTHMDGIPAVLEDLLLVFDKAMQEAIMTIQHSLRADLNYFKKFLPIESTVIQSSADVAASIKQSDRYHSHVRTLRVLPGKDSQKKPEGTHHLRIEESSQTPTQVAIAAEPTTAGEKLFVEDEDPVLMATDRFNSEDLYRTAFEGPWEILLSDRVQYILKAAAKDDGIRDPIFSNFKCIADGFWTSSVAKRLTHPDLLVPVYESKVLGNLRIVWQIDVGFLEARQTNGQYIKVWSIGNHKDVITTLKRVAAAHKTYSKEHIRRCGVVREAANRRFRTPEMFHDDGGDSAHVTRIEDDGGSEVDPLLMHDMAVTAKIFLHWIMSSSNDPGEFPFSLSQREDEIVHHPYSLLLCGRSGTGKTSCIVFRLLSMYYAYYMRAKEPLYSILPAIVNASATVSEEPDSSKNLKSGHHLHQIFITASPVFCARVRGYFSRLLQSINRGSLSEKGWENVSLADRTELFLESIAFAGASANNKPESSIDIDLDKRLAFKATEVEEDLNQDLMEEEMEQSLLNSVPESLLSLQSKHFPLFITFRKFVSMARNAFGLQKTDSSEDIDSGMPSELDYPTFLHKFWNRVDLKIRNRFDPSLVFNEIMGVIKGSEAAAWSKGGCLTREEYLKLSDRNFGSFKASRDTLYDAFLQYQSAKGSEKDALDSINEVNRLLNTKGYHGTPIHEIFVDEVQDLTMAQLLPLITICSSPGRGLMFAGDTAQTIARGSAFRFQDLSSMIYRSLEKRGGREFAQRHQPRQFQLTRNYRSHDGILRLAASILDLIHTFFPNSIDNLARDIGAVDGPPPVCFLGKDEDLREVFGLGTAPAGEDDTDADSPNAPGGGSLEFGAEQVILVRNDEDAQELREKLGETALIMTIEQSKGMEFEDVLLFSPFGSSPAGNAWRIFFSQIKGNKIPCPKFSEDKHNILATELKILYTGITRARQRLWIFDPNVEAREPLFSLWKSLSLVDLVTSSSSTSFMFLAQKSTPEKWLKQGRIFFERRQYDAALLCFRQENRLKPSAESKQRCVLTEANLNRVKGLQLAMEGLKSEAKELFTKAGHDYLAAGGEARIKSAAQCFERAGQYNLAGESFAKINLHGEAARCFLISNNHCMAGKSFALDGKLEEALTSFKAGDHWLEAIDVIAANHPEEGKKESAIPYPLVVRIIKLASKYYGRIGNVAMRIRAIQCIRDVDEKARVFRTERLFKPLAEMLMEARKFEWAAKVYEQDLGDLKMAVVAFELTGSTSAYREFPPYFVITLHLLVQLKLRSLEGDNFDTKQRHIGARLERQCQALILILNPKQDIQSDGLNKLLRRFEEDYDGGGLLLALLAVLTVSGRYRASIGKATKDETFAKKAMSLLTLEIRWALKLKRVIEGFWAALAGYRFASTYYDGILHDVGDLERTFGYQPDFLTPATVRISNMKRVNPIELNLTDCGMKDEVGRYRMSVSQAHAGLRAMLVYMLVEIPSELDRFSKYVNNCQPCIARQINRKCMDPSCSKEHSWTFERAEELINSVTGMAELFCAARQLVKNSFLPDFDKARVRWLEASIQILNPWSEGVATDNTLLTRKKRETCLVLGEQIRNLVLTHWIPRYRSAKNAIDIDFLIRIASTLSLVERDREIYFRQLQDTLYGSQFPTEATLLVCNAFGIASALKSVDSAISLGSMAVKDWKKSFGDGNAFLCMMERAASTLILLIFPSCLLPRHWAIDAVERFPDIRLGQYATEEGALNALKRIKELVNEIIKADIAKATALRIRLSILFILLNQNFKAVAGIRKARDYVPSDSLKGSGWPLFLVQPNAFAALKRITEVMGDQLWLLIKGAVVKEDPWVAAASAVASKTISIPFFSVEKPLTEILQTAGAMPDGRLRPGAQGDSGRNASKLPYNGVIDPGFAAIKIQKWFRSRKASNRAFDRVFSEAAAFLDRGVWEPYNGDGDDLFGLDVSLDGELDTVERVEKSLEEVYQEAFARGMKKLSMTASKFGESSNEVSVENTEKSPEVRYDITSGSSTASEADLSDDGGNVGFSEEKRARFRYRCWYLAYAVGAICSLNDALDALAPVLTSQSNFSEDDIDIEDEAVWVERRLSESLLKNLIHIFSSRLWDEAINLRGLLDVTSNFHIAQDLKELQNAIHRAEIIAKQAPELLRKRSQKNNGKREVGKTRGALKHRAGRQASETIAMDVYEEDELKTLESSKKHTLFKSRKVEATLSVNKMAKMVDDVDRKPEIRTRYIWMVAFTAAMGGFLFGYEIGIIK